MGRSAAIGCISESGRPVVSKQNVRAAQTSASHSPNSNALLSQRSATTKSYSQRIKLERSVLILRQSGFSRRARTRLCAASARALSLSLSRSKFVHRCVHFICHSILGHTCGLATAQKRRNSRQQVQIVLLSLWVNFLQLFQASFGQHTALGR